MTSELFSFLAEMRLDHDAVVPIQQDGRPQPLASLYRVDPCLERASELIETGRRRPLDLLEAVKQLGIEKRGLVTDDEFRRLATEARTAGA